MTAAIQEMYAVGATTTIPFGDVFGADELWRAVAETSNSAVKMELLPQPSTTEKERSVATEIVMAAIPGGYAVGTTTTKTICCTTCTRPVRPTQVSSRRSCRRTKDF